MVVFSLCVTSDQKKEGRVKLIYRWVVLVGSASAHGHVTHNMPRPTKACVRARALIFLPYFAYSLALIRLNSHKPPSAISICTKCAFHGYPDIVNPDNVDADFVIP